MIGSCGVVHHAGAKGILQCGHVREQEDTRWHRPRKACGHRTGAGVLINAPSWSRKHPISPWAEYRATSTNSELPYWRHGVVLLQDPLELFGVLLQIVKTGREVRPDWPALLLPPDHYGCGLGCACFTGTLEAVEENELGCAHVLERLLPEGLDHDTFNSDEDELALTLLDIVEPLQHPLSVLQKDSRVSLASPSLVASDKILQLASAD